jgi:hypothetical protein
MPRSLFYILSLLCHLLLVVGYMHTATPQIKTMPIVIETMTQTNDNIATDNTADQSNTPLNPTNHFSTNTTNQSSNAVASSTPSPIITPASLSESNVSAPNSSTAPSVNPTSLANPTKSRAASATIRTVKRSCSRIAKTFELKGGEFVITAIVSATGKATAVSFASSSDEVMNNEIRKVAMDMVFIPALNEAGQATTGQAEFKIIHADCR